MQAALIPLAAAATMVAGAWALWSLAMGVREGRGHWIAPVGLLLLLSLQTVASRARSTLHERTARQLAESNRRLDALFRSKLVGLIIRDRTGRATAVNETLRSMIGFDESADGSIDLDSLVRTRPSRQDDGKGEPESNEATTPHELEVTSRNGGRVDLLTASSRTADHEETIDCVVDISEWKVASRALIAARDVLEQTTRDLHTAPVLVTADTGSGEGVPEPVNLEVELLVQRLATANRELEAFSYSVSHDLRTPLRAIDGFSRALLDHHSGALDARGRDYLTRIRNATQRMALLIDDLLKLARVSRTQLRREHLDLTQEAMAVIELLRSGSPGRQVAVDIADDLTVDADPRLLRVILENLLGNAWKFTARTEKASITLGTREIDGTTAFFIADNGAGFDMAYADQLFGVFQRLHTTEEFEGTGVGLATVQRVLQMHGGRIWVEAAAGRGATFFFTFGGPSGQARNFARGVA